MSIGVVIGAPLAARLMFDFRDEGSRAISGAAASLAALGTGIAVVGVIALLACTAPTLRALRIQPTEALRAE
jgi:ABC-type lipoprotein release transport system permease subunit